MSQIQITEVKSLREVSSLDHWYLFGCKTRSKLDGQLTITLFVHWADLFYRHKTHSTEGKYVRAIRVQEFGWAPFKPGL